MLSPKTQVVVGLFRRVVCIASLLAGVSCTDEPLEPEQLAPETIVDESDAEAVNFKPELVQPETHAEPVSDNAAFAVILNSPEPYQPIGDGIITLSASLSGAFERPFGILVIVILP